MLAVLVGPHDIVFEPVEQAVRDKGHNVIRYRTEEEFLADTDALRDADVLFAVGSLPLTRARLEKAPKLRAIISAYTGTEGFDEAAATDLGILVGNGQVPENYESMAEATILIILACLYDLNGNQRRLIEGAPSFPTRSHMLKGKTLGLIGFGKIARAIVQRLAPWGVDFLIAARGQPTDLPARTRHTSLDVLLEASDVVCVLAPLNETTRNLLDGPRLARLKQGAILINTSRGGIVDENALHFLVQKGHLAAIGFDVFGEEPLPMNSPLRTLDNAVLTPHSIGHTVETMNQLPLAGAQSVLNVLAGRPALYVRNRDILPTWTRRWGEFT